MSNNVSDGERAAAIVAFLDHAKPAPLRHFVADVQRSLAAELGSAFVPRPVASTHTTIIGLDDIGPIPPDGDQFRVPAGPVDVAGLAKYLTAELAARPLLVQYGGFTNRDYPVSSRGSRLIDRSIVVHDTDVVLIGWPVDDNGEPTTRLDGLRRHATTFGVEHRYPLSADEADPDAHMVIGDLVAPVADLTETLGTIRTTLSERPCRAELGQDQLTIVLYDDPRLPVTTTTALPLTDLA